MNNSVNQEKGRIHFQIGSIPDLFSESNGNIHDLSRGYIHYAYLKKEVNLLDLKKIIYRLEKEIKEYEWKVIY